jgi:serine/threonine-protein kinase
MGLLTDTRTLQPTLVGGCRLDRVVLDRPGFPTLYDAVRVETGEKASVRLYEIEADRRTVRRFRRTVERRAELEHPHLIEIHGAGVWEGRLVLATGPQSIPSLGYRLQEGPLPPGEMLEIMDQVADALDFAADGGFLDLELGVGSILLDPDRGVQLGDLGIWVAFTPGLAPWEHPYPMHISPETARGEPLQRASNVYSLASVMFDCLTGAPPYEGHVVKVMEAHAEAAPPRPSERDPGLGPEIDRVFERAMAKDPASRYETASDMVRAAHEALGVSPVTRRPVSATPLPTFVDPAPRRRRGVPRGLARAGVTLLAAAALIAGGYALGSSGDAEPAPAATPGPQPAIAASRATLNADLGRLDAARLRGRARLASARTRRGQARAASSLAGEYGRAARSVRPVALRPSLRGASEAYAGLARAARRGDRTGFAVARRRVQRAEAALRRELSNL